MVDLSSFFVAVGTYLALLVFAMGAVRGRFGQLRLVRGLGWVGVLLGPAMLCWGLAEPYFPEVTFHRIVTPLVHGPRPVRIVQLSDTHTDSLRLEERLPGLVASLTPDVVVFTGDAINADEGLPHFRQLMTRLAQQTPTYAVRGNWDVWWFERTDLFGGTGVRVLDGRGARLDIRGTVVWLAGAAVDNEYLLGEALRRAPKGSFRIALHHYPAAGRLAAEDGADLALAGDTHGGQVVLPLLGPLVRIRRMNAPFFESGLHRLGDTRLYVNRGLGMEGHGVPPLRVHCRPEIAVFDLVAPAPR